MQKSHEGAFAMDLKLTRVARLYVRLRLLDIVEIST